MAQIHLGNIPVISITSPTPPRPVFMQGTTSANATPTPKGFQLLHAPYTAHASPPVRTNPPCRLLYRGALSIPDSHLLLDGLTFAARLESPSKHNSLLENPLALALESMRGRPSLRFMEVVQLKDVFMDESGGIEMDIHPRATLTRIYFENMFCLSPFPSASTSSATIPARSQSGVKVALGDSDGPETTQILIFAQTSSSSSSSNAIHLCVARITPTPPKPVARLPRPDDPIPRKPPIVFSRELKRTASGALPQRELKRVASIGPGAAPAKRQKLSRTGSLAELGSVVRLGQVNGGEFKVPEVPMTVRKNAGKGKEEKTEDVFGDVTEVVNVSASKAKGKGKKVDEQQTFEDSNKALIKKVAQNYLSRTKDPTIPPLIDKAHPDFKEIWGHVYRGTGFALRNLMKTRPLDVVIIERFVKIHADMYVRGMGDLPPHALDDVDMQGMN